MKRFPFFVAAGLGVLLVAGCSNDTNDVANQEVASTATSSADSLLVPAAAETTMPMNDIAVAGTGAPPVQNAADVAFAQGMIPHHSQAVGMAQLVIDQGSNAEVRALAEKIKAAQAPEIEQMRKLLAAWGTPEAMEGMENMEGMVSDEHMASLGLLSGSELDKKFVELMIAHHAGAVAIAKMEKASGGSPEAVALAEAIIAGQQAEIDQMKGLQPKL